jgi:hypothetical protein
MSLNIWFNGETYHSIVENKFVDGEKLVQDESLTGYKHNIESLCVSISISTNSYLSSIFFLKTSPLFIKLYHHAHSQCLMLNYEVVQMQYGYTIWMSWNYSVKRH